MKTLDEIKQLMAADDTAQADAALKELLADEPDNLQANMLYGTCRQLLGDGETFKRIHDELAPVVEKLENGDSTTEIVSLWKKYHQTFTELTPTSELKPSTASTKVNFGTEALVDSGADIPNESAYEQEPDIETIYGCPPYERKKLQNGWFEFHQRERRRRRNTRIGCLLLIATLFLFWLAWRLGQIL